MFLNACTFFKSDFGMKIGGEKTKSQNLYTLWNKDDVYRVFVSVHFEPKHMNTCQLVSINDSFSQYLVVKTESENSKLAYMHT